MKAKKTVKSKKSPVNATLASKLARLRMENASLVMAYNEAVECREKIKKENDSLLQDIEICNKKAAKAAEDHRGYVKFYEDKLSESFFIMCKIRTMGDIVKHPDGVGCSAECGCCGFTAFQVVQKIVSQLEEQKTLSRKDQSP